MPGSSFHMGVVLVLTGIGGPNTIRCRLHWWMHLRIGAVERHSLNFDLHDLCLLEWLESSIQNARLRPTVHACVNRLPVTEVLWAGDGHWQWC